MKSHISLVLVLALFLTFCPIVNAEESNGFSDIDSNDWYYNDIIAAKKYKAINGYGDGSFKPLNDITHIEALKLAVLSTMTLSKKNGSDWSSKYVDSANSFGVEIVDEDKNEPITRYEFFYYIYRLLCEKYDFSYRKREMLFTDYNDYITTFLYKKGIICGINEGGFLKSLPNKTLTRAEAVVIFNRVVSFVFETNTRDIIVYPSEIPKTEDEIRQTVLYMGINDIREASFSYPQDVDYRQIVQQFLNEFNDSMGEYYQYFSNITEFKAQVSGQAGKIIITVKMYTPIINAKEETAKFKNSCQEINNYLWNTGVLDLEMTQKDIAKRIFKYICYNYEYNVEDKYLFADERNQGNIMMDSGKGICTGYTVIFNELCKLNGIKSLGVVDDVGGEGHVYSRSILDGETYFSDVTFGDPVPDIKGYYNESWFAMTASEISKESRNLGREYIGKFDIGND